MKSTLQKFISKASYNKKLVAGTVLALSLGLCYGVYQIIHHVYAQEQNYLVKAPETLVGSIVTLKLLKEEYYVDYHNVFSETVRKNLEFPEVITLGYTIKYLQEEQRKAEEGIVLLYCIFDNKDNKLIGSIEIRDKNDQDPGQFGWWINEAYWGGGRALEALKLITKTYFKLKPKEKSFIVHVRLWNERSYRALLKGGFEDIGYFYEDGNATRHILEMKRK
jgi:RimJ/RimL family protein N-acetyltransferase